MASTWPASNDSLAINRTDATTMATTHADDHNNANDAINKIERSRMGPWMPRDFNNLRAWSNPPQGIAGVTAAGAGSVILAKIPVLEDFTAARIEYIVFTAGSGAQLPVNVFFGVYNSSGTRLGVTADQATPVQSAGWKNPTLTVDGGQSLALTAGTFVYGAFLIGTQSTTNVLIAGFSSSTVIPQLGSATAANYVSAFSGSAQTALPASFTPSSVTTYRPYFLALGV